VIRFLFPGKNHINLEAGHYWLSPYGIGNGSGEDKARWGTANFDGPVNFSEGYFMS
jgi:hypothetical protein